MVGDERKDVREEAVTFIQQSRQKQDPDNGVRKFEVEKLNWEANFYFEIVNLYDCNMTEPPLLREISNEDLLSIRDSPLVLPRYEFFSCLINFYFIFI